MFSLKPKYSEYSDEYLVQMLTNGDSEAFNQLYERYSNRLLYYFYRMLGNSNEKAQDFLQDIFIKLMSKSSTFDPSRKFNDCPFIAEVFISVHTINKRFMVNAKFWTIRHWFVKSQI